MGSSSENTSRPRRSAPALPAAALALLLALLPACGGGSSGDDTPAPDPDNEAPMAVLTAPTQARAGDPVNFGAADSTDEDGQIVTYLFEFGDDTPFFEGISPSTFHTYSEPGRYEVTLTVIDDDGRKDSVSTLIAIE